MASTSSYPKILILPKLQEILEHLAKRSLQMHSGHGILPFAWSLAQPRAVGPLALGREPSVGLFLDEVLTMSIEVMSEKTSSFAVLPVCFSSSTCFARSPSTTRSNSILRPA